jgi:hypothetical protein
VHVRKSSIRRRFRTFAVAAALAASASGGVGNGGSAAAAGFTAYSYGQESSGGLGYTGIQVTRTTTAVTGLPNDGCNAKFAGTPVYQTSWVSINPGVDWDETGIGHQCQDTVIYYFGGYGENGAWFPLWTANAVNGNQHVYQIDRTFNGSTYFDTWRFDGGVRATLGSNSRAAKVRAGLESYCAGCKTKFNSSSLKYQRFEGAFVNWAGMDLFSIDPGMCGSWVAATTWRSGEGGC